MINEGKGISDIIKEDVDKIYQLFLDNSYSTHTHKFGNDKFGFKNLIIKFNHLNNYYSNIQIDKLNTITVNIGIPDNGKEKRIKENIVHELTHVIEIIGLGDKDYPRYNKIKISLREFKYQPISKAMDFITDVFYKTLDNEINANVAQTYTYLRNFNTSDENILKKKLEEYSIRIEYKQLLNFNIEKFNIFAKLIINKFP